MQVFLNLFVPKLRLGETSVCVFGIGVALLLVAFLAVGFGWYPWLWILVGYVELVLMVYLVGLLIFEVAFQIIVVLETTPLIVGKILIPVPKTDPMASILPHPPTTPAWLGSPPDPAPSGEVSQGRTLAWHPPASPPDWRAAWDVPKRRRWRAGDCPSPEDAPCFRRARSPRFAGVGQCDDGMNVHAATRHND
jgi:hypothetical protein